MGAVQLCPRRWTCPDVPEATVMAESQRPRLSCRDFRTWSHERAPFCQQPPSSAVCGAHTDLPSPRDPEDPGGRSESCSRVCPCGVWRWPSCSPDVILSCGTPRLPHCFSGTVGFGLFRKMPFGHPPACHRLLEDLGCVPKPGTLDLNFLVQRKVTVAFHGGARPGTCWHF